MFDGAPKHEPHYAWTYQDQDWGETAFFEHEGLRAFVQCDELESSWSVSRKGIVVAEGKKATEWHFPDAQHAAEVALDALLVINSTMSPTVAQNWVDHPTDAFNRFVGTNPLVDLSILTDFRKAVHAHIPEAVDVEILVGKHQPLVAHIMLRDRRFGIVEPGAQVAYRVFPRGRKPWHVPKIRHHFRISDGAKTASDGWHDRYAFAVALASGK